MFIKVSFKQFHVDYTIHLNFVLFQSELKSSFKKIYDNFIFQNRRKVL